MRNRCCRAPGGFTLVELLLVIIILAVLAAIMLRRIVGASSRARNAARQDDIALLQKAVLRYYQDCDLYPQEPADLAAENAPDSGLDRSGVVAPLNTASWHGPYVQAIPQDPVTKKPYVYYLTPPTVGKVSEPAGGAAIVPGP